MQEVWLQLSRLYAALGEEDVLLGVSVRAANEETTRKAIEFELDGEYSKAIGCYDQVRRGTIT